MAEVKKNPCVRISWKKRPFKFPPFHFSFLFSHFLSINLRTACVYQSLLDFFFQFNLSGIYPARKGKCSLIRCLLPGARRASSTYLSNSLSLSKSLYIQTFNLFSTQKLPESNIKIDLRSGWGRKKNIETAARNSTQVHFSLYTVGRKYINGTTKTDKK